MKRKATHLFTALVLATSAPAMAAFEPLRLPTNAPAPGNVLSKGSKEDYMPRTESRTTRKQRKERAARAAVAKATRPIVDSVRSLFAVRATGDNTVAEPTKLKNGSPANGNVARRPSAPPRREPVEQPTPTSNNN